MEPYLLGHPLNRKQGKAARRLARQAIERGTESELQARYPVFDFSQLDLSQVKTSNPLRFNPIRAIGQSDVSDFRANHTSSLGPEMPGERNIPDMPSESSYSRTI